MTNNFRQKFFSLLLALLMMVELLPLTTLHSHAAGPSSQTISFDYTSEYDDPTEALIDKATENFSRDRLSPGSVFSENSWARVYDGELTKNGGKMRDYLQSSRESEKYIIMAEDIEVRIGRGEWVPIRITSDKVLDLNGFTLTYWDITNKTDNEDNQSTEVTHHYENKYLFEIKSGATLTIIDSSMSTNGVDTTLGRGEIIAGAYMIDAFDEQIDYYTTRDIFNVQGNLVIYGGKIGRAHV